MCDCQLILNVKLSLFIQLDYGYLLSHYDMFLKDYLIYTKMYRSCMSKNDLRRQCDTQEEVTLVVNVSSQLLCSLT